MALSAASEIPIIDFSKDVMKPGTETWNLTREHVVKALEDYGCFKATFNEINNELYTAMFNSLEKMFDLPKNTKRRFTSNEPYQGYTSDIPSNPLYEAMGVSNPLNTQTIQNLTLALFPHGDASFCKTMYSYVTRVSELENTVRKMIFESYGVEKYFEDETEAVKYSLRLMKYGATMSDEDILGSVPHYDKNFLTILQEDGVGLQVPTKDGEWINTLPTGSSLTVVVGESFHGWSNGRLKCCLHRVMMNGLKSRYSVGFFTNKEGKVNIRKELIDEQHPQLFKPFDQLDLLQNFMQQVAEKTYADNETNIVPIVASHYAM